MKVKVIAKREYLSSFMDTRAVYTVSIVHEGNVDYDKAMMLIVQKDQFSLLEVGQFYALNFDPFTKVAEP